MSNNFLIKQRWINFHSLKKKLWWSFLIQGHWKAITLFGISTFFHHSALWSLKSVLYFIVKVELFLKKSVRTFSSSFMIYFGVVVNKRLENNIWWSYCFKTLLLPISWRFFIFHIFNTSLIYITALDFFFNFLL